LPLLGYCHGTPLDKSSLLVFTGPAGLPALRWLTVERIGETVCWDCFGAVPRLQLENCGISGAFSADAMPVRAAYEFEVLCVGSPR
jgi:hypothetical protein